MALPFAIFNGLRVPEQALGGILLGFVIVVEDKPSELPCTSCILNLLKTYTCYVHVFIVCDTDVP